MRTSLVGSFLLLQHVLLVLLEWFRRWEISGPTAAVLWAVASWIYSKEREASFCTSNLTFFLQEFRQSPNSATIQ